MTCDVPHREKKFTVKFQKVSPSPFGLEFEEGAYYIICKLQHVLRKGRHSALSALAKTSFVCDASDLWCNLRVDFRDHFARMVTF